MRKHFALTIALLLAGGSSTFANGVGPHFVNGIFDLNEWTVGSSLAPNVNKVVFPIVGAKGGSSLYAAQGTGAESGLLFLMFDYTRNLNPVTSSSFFDVFFQVPPLNKDFGVHITQSGFSVFEKPNNTVSLLNADGSLKFSSSPWTPAPSGDLSLGQFLGAIGSGASPDLATPHQMAEFQVSINTLAFNPPGSLPGLYDPSSAFWSASNKGFGVGDPPISSAIFELRPDGTTIIRPVFGADGGPVLQPGDVVPAPVAVWGGVGLMGMLAGMRLRKEYATWSMAKGKK